MVLELFDCDCAPLCEAALQGLIFREEIEISSASGVYLHEGSARITLIVSDCLHGVSQVRSMLKLLRRKLTFWVPSLKGEPGIEKFLEIQKLEHSNRKQNKTFESRYFQAKVL